MIRARRFVCALAFITAMAACAPGVAQKAENRSAQSLPETTCTKVDEPDVIETDKIGVVKLLGIHSPASSDFGYDKALAATKKFVENQTVHVKVCPVRGKDAQDHVRAVVFYTEDGRWYNLNTKLLRAGLASVVVEKPCHLNTQSWVKYVREAKRLKRGIFHEGQVIPLVVRVAAQASAKAAVNKAEPIGVANQRITFWKNYQTPKPEDIDVSYFVGSIMTRRFHRFDCPAAPKEPDRVYFPHRLQALKLHYKPCLICRP